MNPFIYYIEIASTPSIDAPHQLGLHLRTESAEVRVFVYFRSGQKETTVKMFGSKQSNETNVSRCKTDHRGICFCTFISYAYHDFDNIPWNLV